MKILSNYSKKNYKIILIILVVIFVVLFFYFNYKESLTENMENISVPLVVYHTYYTKDLPKEVKDMIDEIKHNNPEFEYQLFDDEDCRKFIIKYFDVSVIDAYDRLIPGAFKSDLWRNCILFVNGGIYLDIKLKPINGFKLTSMTDKEYFVRDTDKAGRGVFNGIIAVKPHNERLLKAIYMIVDNVKNNYYGDSCLDPTGPNLLKKLFTEDEISQFELYLVDYQDNVDPLKIQRYINKGYNHIFDWDKKAYSSYKKKGKTYSDYWNERSIYVTDYKN
jgi:mannosyltransferase OCH1-like enzyme